jgi:hypothetical protein
MSEWSIEHAWKACVRETVPWVRIPLSPPIPSFVPADEQVERLIVSRIKSSAIEGAVRKHRFEESALFGRILRSVKKFGLLCEF